MSNFNEAVKNLGNAQLEYIKESSILRDKIYKILEQTARDNENYCTDCRKCENNSICEELAIYAPHFNNVVNDIMDLLKEEIF